MDSTHAVRNRRDFSRVGSHTVGQRRKSPDSF
jgi:hypothetical protein